MLLPQTRFYVLKCLIDWLSSICSVSNETIFSRNLSRQDIYQGRATYTITYVPWPALLPHPKTCSQNSASGPSSFKQAISWKLQRWAISHTKSYQVTLWKNSALATLSPQPAHPLRVCYTPKSCIQQHILGCPYYI